MFLVANRAPTVTYSICFVSALLFNGAARARLRRLRHKAALSSVVVLVPLAVTLGSIWVRDVPGAAYNYLEQAYASQGGYPAGNVTAADKLARLWWLVSAEQFDYMFRPTARTIKGQCTWLKEEVGTDYPPVTLLSACIVALGVGRLWRANATAGLFAAMMVPAAVVPVVLIRAYSHVTLLGNLHFARLWYFGLGLTSVMEWYRSVQWKACALGFVGVMYWWTAHEAALWRRPVHYDARDYIARVHLGELPAGATLLDAHPESLVHHQYVDGIGTEVKVLMPHGRMSRVYLESVPGRVFTTESLPRRLEGALVGDGAVREIILKERGGDG